MKKWLVGLTCVVMGVASVQVATAQILAFEFSALTGSEVTASSATNDANLNSSTISRGAGLTASANGGRFNATAWALTSIANAVSGNNYMEFTITPQAGYQFGVSSIYVQWQRSSTGNSVISLRSSVDNYASDLASNWTLTDGTTTQSNTWTFTQVDSTNPVTYRLYSYAEAAAGTGGPGDGAGNDIVVYGTVTPSGPAVFGVTTDKTNGFVVVTGSSSTILATAANGAAPYTYGWTSSLGGTYFTADTNRFTILATAPTGSYSATVVAEDAGSQSATNTVTFNVVAPYAITITTPTNGTVTTTPATEAVAGATVTINATANGGYRIASISVVDGALNPVTVTGNTFTMPASAVTVTVLFEVYIAPDVLLDFETNNTTMSASAYTAATSTVSSINVTHQRVLRGNSASDRTHGAYSARFYPVTGTNAFLFNTAAFAQPINKINFWYANYGSDNGTTFKVQVSQDGSSWTDVGLTYDPESTNLVEAVIDTIPANSTYFQFIAVSGTVRVNIDDIGLWFGAASYSVTVDKTNGFQVVAGATSAITATAAHGTEPYGYAWGSTLGGSYYTAVSNVFTILATAPTGSYSATVTATDAVSQTVTNTVTFNVVTAYAIAITPPTNGTVTTAPTTAAVAGTTVTINTTPDSGYKVNLIAVVGGDLAPVTVTGNTFVMPAQAVTVTVTYRLILDTATLPTAFTGPGWNPGTAMPDGWTQTNMGTDYTGSLDATGFAGKFDTTGPALRIKYGSAATQLTYWLQLNGTWTNSNVFKVQESVDGSVWTDLVAFTDTNSIPTSKAQFTNVPAASSRYIQFIYVTKVSGNVEIDGVALSGDVTAAVVVSGSLSGTVGVALPLTITATNGTATSWVIGLLDPTNGVVSTYTFNEGTGAFSFTPAQVGAYSLSATAMNGASVLATTNVTLTVSAAPLSPDIGPITVISSGNFSFVLPDGYNLLAVYGADTTVGVTSNWTWTPLTITTDYTVSGRTVTILSHSGGRKIIRIGVVFSPG